MNKNKLLNEVILNRNKIIVLMVSENVVSGGLQEPNPVFPIGAMIQYL